MGKGVTTEEGVICAYDEFVLIRPVEKEPKKGTVLSVGDCVPDPIGPGDLIYYTSAIKLEEGICVIHCSNILAYSRFIDEYEDV